MVLFCITGELGSGKTLGLTFLGFKNWMFRKQKIYSNYHLYQIPYIYIDGIDKLDQMRDGFVMCDEMWIILDSRCSRSIANRLTSSILLKSRKRDLTYCFTAQMLDLLDKRIRKILDFTAYPILNAPESVCKVSVFRTGFPKTGSYMKTFYFNTEHIFNCYDTREEITMEAQSKNPENIIVFQESPDAEPKFFKTWEEADSYGSAWYMKKYKTMQGIY